MPLCCLLHAVIITVSSAFAVCLVSAQDHSRVKLRWPKWLTPDVVSPSPPLGRLSFQLENPSVKLLLHHSSSQLSTANPNQCFCVQSSLIVRLTQPAAGWAASGSKDELC